MMKVYVLSAWLREAEDEGMQIQGVFSSKGRAWAYLAMCDGVIDYEIQARTLNPDVAVQQWSTWNQRDFSEQFHHRERMGRRE